MDRTSEHHQEFIRPGVAQGERPAEQRQVLARTVVGFSTVEAIVGAGAAVLGVLGLIGVFPLYMAAIGAIGIGASLLIESGGIALRYSQLSGVNASRALPIELGGGTSAEMLGGLSGITLGILALVGIEPLVLLPVAAIVYGGALVFGTSATTRASSALDRISTDYSDRARQAAQDAVLASQGARLLIGVGVATMGILVLADIGPAVVLTLVSVLALGAVTMLSGSALGARSGMMLH